MDEPPRHLDQIHRDGVLEAIQAVSAHRDASLLAAHMRSNYVHTVVADVPPSVFER